MFCLIVIETNLGRLRANESKNLGKDDFIFLLLMTWGHGMITRTSISYLVLKLTRTFSDTDE